MYDIINVGNASEFVKKVHLFMFSSVMNKWLRISQSRKTMIQFQIKSFINLKWQHLLHLYDDLVRMWA